MIFLGDKDFTDKYWEADTVSIPANARKLYNGNRKLIDFNHCIRLDIDYDNFVLM